MTPEFSFSVDHSRAMVCITMSGLFLPEDIARFRRALGEAHGTLNCARNQHVTLVDIRRMNIQTQESVGAFRALLLDPAIRSRRIAFVVETSLSRMQIQRAAAGRGAGFFRSVAEAEAWLCSPGCA